MNYFLIFLALLATTICVQATIFVVEPGENIQLHLMQSTAGDTILVRPGEYSESLRLPSHEIVLSSNFIFSFDTLDIANTILYPDSVFSDTNSCIVVTSGNQICHRVIGLTLQDGRGTRLDIRENELSGGAVHVRSSCLTIETCRVLGGKATLGGGIAAIGPNSNSRLGFVEVNDCTIQDCSAQEEGGGLYAYSCSLAFDNCLLLNDSCFNFSGGIESRNSYLNGSNTSVDSAFGPFSSLSVSNSEVFLNRCTFTRGATPQESFVYSFFHIGNSVGRLTACSFSDNLTEYPSGSIVGDSAPEIVGCVFERIRATVFTATVLIGYDDNTQFAYNIVRDNLNVAGGAIQPFQRTTAHIHHNLVTGNRSLQSNRPSAIMCVSHCNPLVDSNRIELNEGISAGFIPELGEHHWDLSRNWWGHESGPFHATLNPGGQGDTIVSDSIEFSPWLTSPPETTVGVERERQNPPVASTWDILTIYPNPFNSSFVISIAGFARNDFSIKLVDLLGRQVAMIHEGTIIGSSLQYTAPVNLASGIYFLVASDKVMIRTNKIVFLK